MTEDYRSRSREKSMRRSCERSVRCLSEDRSGRVSRSSRSSMSPRSSRTSRSPRSSKTSRSSRSSRSSRCSKEGPTPESPSATDEKKTLQDMGDEELIEDVVGEPDDEEFDQAKVTD